MKTKQRGWQLAVMLIFWGTSCAASGAANGAGAAARQDDSAKESAPRAENAKFETRDVTGSLAETISEVENSTSKPQWIGYAANAVEGEHTVCSGNYGDGGGTECGRCALESEQEGWGDANGKSGAAAGALKLEGNRKLAILLRVQDGRVMRIKVASQECVLDAGGLPFVWLKDVKAAENVALLSTFVREENAAEHDKHSLWNGALAAIALQDGREAQAALESFAAPTQREELRKQTAFWMGALRGKDGVAVLQRIAKNDPSAEVRAQVAFALSVSKEPAALDEMIRMAHEDANAHVRGQALFWLAQKAGKRAVGAIDGAIENDPDTEVKKQAVFALSQLPKDEGVPKLIQVAENNHNPVVRKQAMFWLGQSQDPRALDFFEKVLSK
jgi:HEAT repeat protein